MSPLYQELRRKLQEQERYLTDTPEHASNPTDRLFARPDEFARQPLPASALKAWHAWQSYDVTAHDRLIRVDHPVVVAAVQRCQSATSLSRLLRDPLGYLWRYGFGWKTPDEAEEPLQLDAVAQGELLHEVLDHAVSQLEYAHPEGFAGADYAARVAILATAIAKVAAL